MVISLSRIGESLYFVCRIRQDNSPVYLYYDQNLNHNMNNLMQHLLHVVNIIYSKASLFETSELETSEPVLDALSNTPSDAQNCL